MKKSVRKQLFILNEAEDDVGNCASDYNSEHSSDDDFLNDETEESAPPTPLKKKVKTKIVSNSSDEKEKKSWRINSPQPGPSRLAYKCERELRVVLSPIVQSTALNCTPGSSKNSKLKNTETPLTISPGMRRHLQNEDGYTPTSPISTMQLSPLSNVSVDTVVLTKAIRQSYNERQGLCQACPLREKVVQSMSETIAYLVNQRKFLRRKLEEESRTSEKLRETVKQQEEQHVMMQRGFLQQRNAMQKKVATSTSTAAMASQMQTPALPQPTTSKKRKPDDRKQILFVLKGGQIYHKCGLCPPVGGVEPQMWKSGRNGAPNGITIHRQNKHGLDGGPQMMTCEYCNKTMIRGSIYYHRKNCGVKNQTQQN